MRLKTRFLANLEDIVFDLSKKKPTNKGKSGSADMISLGDSWLSFAIKEKLIEPMKGVEYQDWYKGLSDKWKVRMCFIVSKLGMLFCLFGGSFHDLECLRFISAGTMLENKLLRVKRGLFHTDGGAW